MDFVEYFAQYLQAHGWQTRRVDAEGSDGIHLIAIGSNDERIGLRLIENPNPLLSPEDIDRAHEAAQRTDYSRFALITRGAVSRTALRHAARLGPTLILIGADRIGETAKILENLPPLKPPELRRTRRRFAPRRSAIVIACIATVALFSSGVFFFVRDREAPGLHGEYFDDAELGHFVFSRIDPTIEFDWTDADPHPDYPATPDPSIPRGPYSIRWNGRIRAPVAAEGSRPR
jgi:hypothetical protein